MENSSSQNLSSIIVGLGRAGFDLHIPILHKVRENEGNGSPFLKVIGLVDSLQDKVDRALHKLVDSYKYSETQIVCARSIDSLQGLDLKNSVVHICTPANSHAISLLAAAKKGFKRIIIEKPCAVNVSEVDEMRKIRDKYDLNVVIVNPYLYSRSLGRCRRVIENSGTMPHYIEFELSKPRKKPTLVGRSTADSVFDVEMPHQIAAVLYLTQAKKFKVLRSEVRHMHYRETDRDPCNIVLNMGLGIILLELDQHIAMLVSYLDAPTRTRVLKLRFYNGDQVEAYFPVSEDDHTSEVKTYGFTGSDGSVRQLSSDKFPDDLFTYCLKDIYSRFASNSPQFSDIEFNRNVVDIMDQAKKLSKVRA